MIGSDRGRESLASTRPPLDTNSVAKDSRPPDAAPEFGKLLHSSRAPAPAQRRLQPQRPRGLLHPVIRPVRPAVEDAVTNRR